MSPQRLLESAVTNLKILIECKYIYYLKGSKPYTLYFFALMLGKWNHFTVHFEEASSYLPYKKQLTLKNCPQIFLKIVLKI